MGNITGEHFLPYVTNQIKQRQEQLGKVTRGDDQLLQQNAKSAWIKLTSSILVKDTSKFNFPSDVADKYSLFGGTMVDKNVLGGLKAYTEFGYEQGYRPAPGIVSFETKNRNRGSVRESTFNIKAYSREQFEYLDVLFLRLGYSVLIEFGNSLYIDNTGAFKKFDNSQTLTSSFLDGTYRGNQFKLLQDIQAKRIATSANYDAIFGRISNYTWNFLPDGSYDINLIIMSYGDVIEALKSNVAAEDTGDRDSVAVVAAKQQQVNNALAGPVASGLTGFVQEWMIRPVVNFLTGENTQAAPAVGVDEEVNPESLLQAATTDAEVIDILENTDILGRLFWDIKTDILRNPGPGSENCKSLQTANAFRVSGYKKYDALKTYNKGSGEDYFYIRFGALLQYLWDKGMMYINPEGTQPIIALDNDPVNNLIFKTPYTFSGNPLICIVKGNIELIDASASSDFSGTLYSDIPEAAVFQDSEYPDAGRLMNVYVNMAWVLQQAQQNKDSKNKVKFYELIESICKGIESSLGGQNTLNPTVDPDTGRFYILDEHVIPSVREAQGEIPNADRIKLYGLNPGVQGTFIRDFGIQTSITNELASTITIGAQANGSIKGEDATAFSAWNRGLVDRILVVKTNKDEVKDESNPKAEADLQKRYKKILQEYINFLTGQSNYEWDEDKVDSFTSILTNMITFKESAAAVNQEKASGILGFLPIDLNATMDGISGIKIYQQFAADTSFLPKNYGLSLRFIITGITHKIENNTWTTHINTVSEPTSVVKLTNDQSFSGIKTQAGPGGEGGTAAVPSGQVVYPSSAGGPVRLRLYRKKEVFATGATGPNGTGQTLGELQVLDANGKVLKTYSTVEEPWRENRSKISCIPPGRYSFTKSKATNNPALGDVLRLGGPVPYRDGVLIHIGSTYEDTEGCILPGKLPQLDNKIVDGVPDNQDTLNVMPAILNYLYPAGSKNETYAIEVFGIPGKVYVDYRDKVTYANPSATPAQDNAKQSYQLYVNYVLQINKVLLLQDVYDQGKPLLRSTKGATFESDNVTEAVNRLKALVNIRTQNIGNKLAPWVNKLPLSKLNVDHKKLFQDEFEKFAQAVLNRNNSFLFRYPTTTNPKQYSNSGYTVNPDY